MGEKRLPKGWVFVLALVMIAVLGVLGSAVAHAADGDDETAVTFYPSDGFVRMDGVSLSNTRVAVQRGECVPFEDFPDMSGELTYTPGRNYWGGSRVHISFEGWNDGGMLPAILEPGGTAIGNTVDETTPIDPPSYMSSARARAVYTYTDAVVLTVTAYGRGAGGGASDYTYHFDEGYSIADDNPENFIRNFVSWGTDGWSGVYLDSEFTEPFDLSTSLTTDTHLYFGPAQTVTRTVTFHGTTGGDVVANVDDGEALDTADVPDAASVDNANFAGWSASEVWPYRPGASDWEGDTFDVSAPITGDAELWPVYAADGFTVHVGYYDGDSGVSDFAERFVPRGYVIADDADLMAAAELDGGNLVGWFDNWYELSDDDRLTEEALGRYAPTHRVDVTEPVTSSGYYVAVYGSLKARDLPVVPPEPDTVAVEFRASDGELLRDGGAYTVDDGTSSAEVERGGRIPADAFPDMSGAFSCPQPDDNGLSPVTLSFDGWRDGGAVQVAVDAPTGNLVDDATEIDPDGDTLALGASYLYADAVTLTVTVDDGTGNPSERSYKVDRGGGIADAGKFARFFDPSGELGAYDGADASTAGTVDLATVAFGDDAHLYFLPVPAPVVTHTVTFHGTTGGDADVSVVDGEALDAADVPDAASVDNANFAGWSASEVWPYRPGASDWEGDTFDVSAPITGDAELWPVYAADGFTVHVGYYDGDTDMSGFVERFVPRGYVIADDGELVDAVTLAGKALVGWFDNWYEFSTDSRLTEAAPGRYAPTHRVDISEPVTSSGYYVAVYGSLKARDLPSQPVTPVTPPTPVYDYVSVSFYAGDGHIARNGEVMAAGDAVKRVSVIRGNRVSIGSFPDMSGVYTLPRSADIGLDPVALIFSGWNDGGTVAVVDYGGGVGGSAVDATTRISRAMGLRAVYAADCVTLTVTVGTGDGGTADYDYLVNRGTVIGSDNGRFVEYFKTLGDGADTVYDGADAATASLFDLDSPLVSDSHVYFVAAASDSQPGDGDGADDGTGDDRGGGSDDGTGDDGDGRDGDGGSDGQDGTGNGGDGGSASGQDGGSGGSSDDGDGTGDAQDGGSDGSNDGGGASGQDDGSGDGSAGDDGGKPDPGDGGGTLDSQDGDKPAAHTGSIPDGVYKDVREAIDATGMGYPPMAKPAAVTRLPQTGDGGAVAVLVLAFAAVGAACLALRAFAAR